MGYLLTLVEFFAGIVAAVFIFNIVVMIRLPARVRKAEALFEQDEVDQAFEIIQKVLQRRKGYIPAMYLKAKILKRQRQYILAIAEINDILKSGDFNRYVSELDLHYLLADLYARQQLFHKELEEYRLIMKLSPNDVTANHAIGLHLYKQKKYRESRDMLIRALAGDPKLADTYLPIGLASYNLSEYGKAEEFLLKAIDVMTGPAPEAYYHLGMIYKMKKDTENAIRMFEFTKRDPDYALRGALRIGEIYFDREMYSSAIETLEGNISWLKQREDDSLAYRYLLAECYEMENMIKEAVHHWEKIQSERPNYKSTQMKLEDYKAIMGDDTLKGVFTASLDSLQPIIAEIIARLNFNIIQKKVLTPHLMTFKAYNIKRINDPPILIIFDRTTREVPEGSIAKFTEMMREEKCKGGIYIATTRFSVKAKSSAASEMIELLDKDFVAITIQKIRSKQK
jgi:tetratricopeptide (TPR) repeat protein